jgi:hypothetical protein
MGELSEDAAPRKKRRLRRLIIALLLVLASGFAWWEWPRGDARFVGDWTVTQQGRRLPPNAPAVRWTLWANGMGASRGPDGRIGAYFPWTVVNGEFQTGHPAGSLSGSLAGRFGPWISRMTKKTYLPVHHRNRLLSVEANVIRYERDSQPGKVTSLNRISK